MKKILLLAVGLNFALLTIGQLIDVEFEVFHVHDATEYTDGGTTVTLEGYTTYRLYANLTNDSDFVSSVSGDINNPLRVGAINDCTEEPVFWHHPTANASPLGPINDAASILTVFPTLIYDSHVTLGWHNVSEYPGSMALNHVGDPEQPWDAEFNAGNSFEINTTIGGVWFTTLGETSPYAYAGDDLRVCLGQFTTKCDIEFLGNVQVFENGMQPEDGDGTVNGVYACSTDNCVPGCTDSAATNYNPAADTDDGSCIYPCTLAIDSIVVTDVMCTGFASGSLDVYTSGNQGQVQYTVECGGDGSPNNTISGLSAGIYTICVTDAEGCTATEMATVTEPEAISVSLSSVTFPSCNGFNDGGLCVNISGGNGGPFYASSMNDAASAEEGSCATGYEAGSNVIYIWENLECPGFISQGFTIAEPGAPIINANDLNDASCANTADGEIALLGQGGTAPYTFSLSLDGNEVTSLLVPSDTILGGLFCGNYTINMIDVNDCPADSVSNVIVECPDVVEVNGVDGGATDISCPEDLDGSISVTGAGGNGTFLYNIGATQEEAEAGPFDNATGSFEDLGADEYWVAASSSGCVGSTIFEVGAPDSITYNLVVVEESMEGEEDASICVENISGGTGDVTWFWSDFSLGECVEGLSTGDVITIELEDENGCEVTETVTITVGIYNLENNISVNMFPNPTTGVINISAEGLNGQKVSAVITNALGAAVQAEDFGNLSGVWNKELNISNASDGVYFLTITIGEDEVTYRVIKN